MNKKIEELAEFLYHASPCTCLDYDETKQVAEKLHAADVVKVVRCNGCPHLIKEIVEEETSYGFTDYREVFGCGRILELTGKWVDVFLDDFCSYGERKEG